jgi:hypothetical protein
MAWHKIGNSYYSTAERRVLGNELLQLLTDLCLPGYLTYLAVSSFAHLLESHYNFFVVHTTTAKLLYILTGLVSFCAAYTLRYLIILLALTGFVGAVLFGISVDFFHWLWK